MSIGDQWSVLQGAVPDYAADEVKKQLAAAQIGQERRLEEAQQHELADEERFQGDLTSYLTNPTPQGASMLVLKHPKHAEQLKTGFEMQDKAKQDSDFQAMGEVYSAATAKKYDVAAALMQRRIDGDKQAGQDTTHDQMIYDALSSGDPVQQKAALGMVGFTLSSIKPDKFNEIYGSLNKDKGGYTLDLGAARYGPDNKMIAHSPFLKDDAGNIRLWNDGTEGGDPASTGGVAVPPSATPAVKAVATTLASGGLPSPVVAGFMGNFHVEGGYDGAQGDGGSASGIGQWHSDRAANFEKVIGKPVTEAGPDEQAKFVLWEMQHPEQAGMTVKQRDAILAAKTAPQAAALIDKFYERSDGKSRQGRMSAATAFAGDSPSGSPTQSKFPVLFPGKSKDAPVGFRYTADGKTLEPIPGGPADDAGLDPDTIHFYAQSVASGQPMPAMGNGKSATKARQQIMKEVRRVMGAEGLSGQDFAIQSAHYKAGLANITNLEKQLGTVSGNELTFAKNAQQVAELARKIPAQTGSRVLNTAVNTYLRQTNDPTVAQLDVAIKTAANEYARLVTASPSGAGPLSDSARMEYQGVIEGNFPLKQKLAALHQMAVDANNRSKSLRSTLQDTYTHLSDRAPELRGGSKGEQWITLPSGLKVRKIR
jgi:hypothetical protein